MANLLEVIEGLAVSSDELSEYVDRGRETVRRRYSGYDEVSDAEAENRLAFGVSTLIAEFMAERAISRPTDPSVKALLDAIEAVVADTQEQYVTGWIKINVLETAQNLLGDHVDAERMLTSRMGPETLELWLGVYGFWNAVDEWVRRGPL